MTNLKYETCDGTNLTWNRLKDQVNEKPRVHGWTALEPVWIQVNDQLSMQLRRQLRQQLSDMVESHSRRMYGST